MSHKGVLLEQFRNAGIHFSNVNKNQFWRHDNHPIELWSNKIIGEKIDYMHNNPVEAGLDSRAEDYLYSSAADYAGEEGILGGVIVIR